MNTQTNQVDHTVAGRSQAPESESLVCVLDALTPEQRQRHEQLIEKVKQSRQSIRELPDGYAWQLPGDMAMWLIAAEFISLEHVCCPFFRLALEVEPGQGSIWLRITGSDQVKQFIGVETGFAAL